MAAALKPENGRQVPQLPAISLACLLTFGLAGCDQGSATDNVGADVDRAVDRGARGWEQASNIADEEASRGPTGRTGAAGSTPDDAALSARVKSALSAEPGLNAMTIEVNALGGAVTLYGTAGTPARRDRAAQIALNVDGVRSVTNHLIIMRES